MDYEQIREYQLKQRAKNIAETPWLILPGENKLTRRAIKLSFIKDAKDPEKFVGVHAEVLYQTRKNKSTPWPNRNVDLTKIPRDFGFKFSLDSAQTYELAQALQDAYPIGSEDIGSRKRTVLRDLGKDEIVVTQKNKAAVLQQLEALLDKDDLNNWITKNIDALSPGLAVARLHQDRQQTLAQFKATLAEEKPEGYWQKFLKQNSWIFGSACVKILEERRTDIHHQVDFPIEVEGGFMDIVEIKTPQTPFWRMSSSGKPIKYRETYLVPHHDLQGSIAQMTKYILQAEKQVDSDEYIKGHGGVIPLKPRGLIVLGRSVDWTREEWEAFRLLNDELHSVQVITFDHLVKQSERLLDLMKTPKEVDEDDFPVDEVPDIDIEEFLSE